MSANNSACASKFLCQYIYRRGLAIKIAAGNHTVCGSESVNGVFPVSRDVLAISRLFSSYMLSGEIFFIYSESVIQRA